LDWPENNEVLIKSLVPKYGENEPHRVKSDLPGYFVSPDEIESISLVGDEKDLKWELIPQVGLRIELSEE
jgi:hypothetical protein